jgi:hypothetical protein
MKKSKSVKSQDLNKGAASGLISKRAAGDSTMLFYFPNAFLAFLTSFLLVSCFYLNICIISLKSLQSISRKNNFCLKKSLEDLFYDTSSLIGVVSS